MNVAGVHKNGRSISTARVGRDFQFADSTLIVE